MRELTGLFSSPLCVVCISSWQKDAHKTTSVTYGLISQHEKEKRFWLCFVQYEKKFCSALLEKKGETVDGDPGTARKRNWRNTEGNIFLKAFIVVAKSFKAFILKKPQSVGGFQNELGDKKKKNQVKQIQVNEAVMTFLLVLVLRRARTATAGGLVSQVNVTPLFLLSATDWK